MLEKAREQIRSPSPDLAKIVAGVPQTGNQLMPEAVASARFNGTSQQFASDIRFDNTLGKYVDMSQCQTPASPVSSRGTVRKSRRTRPGAINSADDLTSDDPFNAAPYGSIALSRSNSPRSAAGKIGKSPRSRTSENLMDSHEHKTSYMRKSGTMPIMGAFDKDPSLDLSSRKKSQW